MQRNAGSINSGAKELGSKRTPSLLEIALLCLLGLIPLEQCVRVGLVPALTTPRLSRTQFSGRGNIPKDMTAQQHRRTAYLNVKPAGMPGEAVNGREHLLLRPRGHTYNIP